MPRSLHEAARTKKRPAREYVILSSVRLVLALALLVAAPAAAQDRACRGVDCSGHGQCFAERDVPLCLCDPGHSAMGLSCVRGAEELPLLSARRDPTAGERVVAIAQDQIGRARRDVGADLGRHPFALRRYLMEGEWWCGDFVSWVYEAAGVGFTSGAAGGWLIANNVALRAWFEQRGQWIGRGSAAFATYEPRPGDYVRFHTDLAGHAGIVHHVSDDTLYTIEGNVGARVEAGRYFHFRNNRLIDGFGSLALPNEAPVVGAGEDARVRWPGDIVLDGSATDDGPSARLLVEWTRTHGPGEHLCDDPSSARARCTVTEPGVHVFELRASDGEHTTVDTVRVEARQNRAPVVQARVIDRDPRQAIAIVEGTAEDDDELAVRWAHVSGPGRALFDDADAAETLVRFPAPGAYVLRFRADDGELEAEHDVLVEVPELSTWGCGAAPGSGTARWWILALALGRRSRRS